MSSRRPAPRSRFTALLAHPSHAPLVHVPRVRNVDAHSAPVIETHGIYIRITPSASMMADPNVRRAVAYNGQWGGLHISLTTFALRQANAYLKKYAPALSVHNGSLVDVVKRGAAYAASMNGWRPSERKQLSRKECKPGKRAIFVDSDFLNALANDARTSGLAKVTDANKFHVTIGNSDYAALEAVLLDRATTFEIGIAVRRGDAVVRFKDAQRLWP